MAITFLLFVVWCSSRRFDVLTRAVPTVALKESTQMTCRLSSETKRLCQRQFLTRQQARWSLSLRFLLSQGFIFVRVSLFLYHRVAADWAPSLSGPRVMAAGNRTAATATATPTVFIPCPSAAPRSPAMYRGTASPAPRPSPPPSALEIQGRNR